MGKNFLIGLLISMVTVVASAVAEAYSIPQDKLDNQKVYYGSAAHFEKPAEVNYEAVVKATPEYAEIKKKKIEAGTAKYWILISRASEHAVRLIAEVGQELEHDLIVAKDYLNKLEVPIEASDVTELVLAKLSEE